MAKPAKPKVKCRRCGDTGEASEWRVPLPFNPASSPQKLDLIRHYGLPVPKKRGTDDDTSEAKYLKRFAKKFPVFGTIVECQQREKLISTYMWPGGQDGRVRTIYGFAPSTWRKSSRNVNLQNIPKRSDLAQLLRRMLVADRGSVLVEADSSAIEAVLVGFCAGDRDYVRMAKLGIHDFVTANWIGRPVAPDRSEAELRAAFREIKREHHDAREAAKRGVHGSNYLLTSHGLHDEYAEYFPTRKKADEFQQFYFGLFPKLRQWHQSTLERAHKEGYLDNHYQYRHYFWSVFQWDRRREQYVLGDDAKRSVAFVPQSDASAIQTEDILTLAGMPEVEPYLRLIIHDSVVLEVPEREAEKVARLVHGVMTRPRPELAGLSIGAEVSWGPSLGEMSLLELKEENATTNSGNLANPADPDGYGISLHETASTGPSSGPAQHI